MKTVKKWVRALAIALALLLLCAAGGFAFLYYNGLSGLYRDAEYTDGQIRVACVGDSITYGHGVQNQPKNNYPAVLGGLLGEGYCVRNFGVSGATVQVHGDQPYWETDRYTESLSFEADIVVLMMGSNDSKPENWKGSDAFKADYNALIHAYLAACDRTPTVYLCTPAMPFYTDGKTEGTVQFDISIEQVEAIDAVVREIAAERGYRVIDIHALTAEHPEWFKKDGVHPDQDGAAAIAEAVAAAISEK